MKRVTRLKNKALKGEVKNFKFKKKIRKRALI